MSKNKKLSAAKNDEFYTFTNIQEQEVGNNQRNADTDNDGLSDSDEVEVGTNPTLADTDRADYQGQWCHSDMKDIAFFFNFKFYEKVIEKGNLK